MENLTPRTSSSGRKWIVRSLKECDSPEAGWRDWIRRKRTQGVLLAPEGSFLFGLFLTSIREGTRKNRVLPFPQEIP